MPNKIDAHYVTYYSPFDLGSINMSKPQYNSPGIGKGAHPLWMITVRGATPYSIDSSVWTNLIDAVGGKWLGARDTPFSKP